MGFYVKAKGNNIEPVKEGIHQAICVGVFDVGTHYYEAFGNRTHKAVFTWELPEQRIIMNKDNELVELPRVISKTYTATVHEKSVLHKDLKGWRNRAFTEKELSQFDLFSMLGKNCMLQIIHETNNNKTYAKITSILPLFEGKKPLRPESALMFYDFQKHGKNIPAGLPSWIVEFIEASDEYKKLGKAQEQPETEELAPGETASGDIAEEDVPDLFEEVLA